MATDNLNFDANTIQRTLDLRRWIGDLSGASLPKMSIRTMVKCREMGKRERSIGNQSSMPNTISAFTTTEKANLVNRFLPNEWTVITATETQLLRCLHLPDDTFVTLGEDNWLRFFAREQSDYELMYGIGLPDTEGLVTDLARSTRGDQLALTTSKAYLYHGYIDQIDDKSSWKMFHTTPLPSIAGWESYFSVRYTLDDEHLIVGGAGGYVSIIGIDEPSHDSFCAHQSNVKAIYCSKANRHLFCSGGIDGCCKLWDDRALNDNLPIALSTGNDYSISYIDGDSYDKYIVTTSIGGTIAIWDLRQFSQNLPFDVQQQQQELNQPGMIKRFDTALRIRGPNLLEIFWRAKISPERTGHRFIYCGSDHGYVYIFDIMSGEVIQAFRKCRNEVYDCSWHPNDNEIISVSLCGSAAKWYYEEKYGDNE